LEGFVKTFKETHGGDHAAPLMSFSESSGAGDSSMLVEFSPIHRAPMLSVGPDIELLDTGPDAISHTSVSSSTPPILPDFPWLSQPSLTAELIDGDLSLKEGAGGVIAPPKHCNNTATSYKSSYSRGWVGR
jgi:hypothetical protein